MVDFVKETVIDVREATERFKVSADTIRRWFRQGLEKRKVGGKVYTSLEAFQRFSKGDQNEPVAQPLSQEAIDALRELRARGFNIGSEARKDGKSKVTA